MISWTLTLLVAVLASGTLAFGGVAGPAAGAAKLCCVLFLGLFLASVVFGRRLE